MPTFTQSWNGSIITHALVDIATLALIFPVAGNFVFGGIPLTGGIYPLAYFAFSALFMIYSLRPRLLSKVKTIRFYDTSIEMSGWKFNKQFTYQDISSLSRNTRTVTFFSENQIAFRIRDERFMFRFKNPYNKKLNMDLYSWMLKKVPPSALQKPISAFE